MANAGRRSTAGVSIHPGPRCSGNARPALRLLAKRSPDEQDRARGIRHIEELEREVLSRWPDAWARLDERREMPVDWSREWCLLPMAATATWMSEVSPPFPPPPVPRVHALYLWRVRPLGLAV
jgi:hypothetical protein